MDDPIATAVEELRAACSVTKTGEVTSTLSLDIAPHGTRQVSIAVAPMEGDDDRWFLEVAIRRDKSRSDKWLAAGSREKVIERLESADVVEAIREAAKSLEDTHFHTDGLPEHW